MKSADSPNQGSLFAVDQQTGHVSAGVSYGPEYLGNGIYEGDATDVSRYLSLYVDAVRELGRGRSNDLGFGALYENSAPVREVAQQHENPDRTEVQATVVNSRKTHFDKANQYLLRRSQFRDRVARRAVAAGLMTTEEQQDLPLLEDAAMIEAQWFGKYGEKSSPSADKARRSLYKNQKSYTEPKAA